jgi:hypothetical protein
MKNIYLLERTDKWNYDEYDSAVVAAYDEDSAKALFPQMYSYGVPIAEVLKVTLIGTTWSDDLDLVLGSYNAG